MKRNRTPALLAGSLSTTIALASGTMTAVAQTAPTTSSQGIEETLVIATKRAANAQDVPLSITVFNGEELAKSQLRDGIAIARLTPNLAAESVMGAAMPRYRLRGIGTNDFVPTATSAVGVYEDEVFLSAGSAQSSPVYDVERVEVLRGPQGSLWGKNTTAGALHFVTAAPTDSTSGQARVSLGSSGTAETEFGLGGGLSDNLSGRIAGVYKERDGQLVNDFTGNKAGGYDIWDLRGQLRVDLGDEDELLLKLHGGESQQGQPLQHIGLLAGGTDFDGYAERDNDKALSNNGPEDTEAHRFGTSARLNLTAGENRLVNIAAYERSRSLIYSDDDANPVSQYHERYGGSSDTFTNELRLESPEGERIDWIIGTYYLQDETNSFGQLALYSPVNFGIDGAAYDFDVETENLAGFASLGYELSERLKLTLGGRYTREEKRIAGIAYDYKTQAGNVFDASVPNLVYINTREGIYQDATGSPLEATPGSRDWKRFTWDVSADYRLADNALVFTRVARGFRSGAYNSYIASPGDLSVYDPETLTAYELGIKTDWLDRRLILNATTFHYQIDDLQVTVLQSVGTRTQNAASAEVNGLELELETRPVDAVRLSIGYGLQDSEYKRFTNASVPFPINRGAPLDLTGQSLERAPRNTLNLAASYEIPLSNGALIFSTDWRYSSRYRFHVWSDATNIDPAPFLATPELRALVRDSFSQQAHWLGDARTTYALDNGLEVAAWVKNLTNEAYRTNSFGMFFNRSITTYPGEWRTYGLSAAYRF